jgi:uncharacterized membrane protein YciS (DUF1049 family)
MGGTALIHAVLASEYLQEQTYIGVLFIAGAIAGAMVAVRLWMRDDLAAWALGAVIAAGMGVGFILSRTVGLPGFHESEWELSGLLSVLLEAAFFGAAVPALARIRGRRQTAAATA